MNLLDETVLFLLSKGKTPESVLWCGNNDFQFSWEDFAKMADKEYDEGFGLPEVAEDLKIVGEDFWLERHEYDGSEEWRYKQYPKAPEKHALPKDLFSRRWLQSKELK